MKVIFCGSGRFALPSLKAIRAGGHELVGVVTQPARPAGRHGTPQPTPVAHLAAELNLPVVECPDVNAPDFVDRLRSYRADVTCVCDFGQFIQEPAREATPLGAFNLHGSLLPALRGAAPVNWAIIHGLDTTGVTTFFIVDRMDAGGVYLQEEADIRPDETAEELRNRLAEFGAPLVLRTLDLLAGGRNEGMPQDHSLATRAPCLTKADGRIDWTQSGTAIRNRIHGTWPWPGGQAVLHKANGKETPVLIARAEVVEGAGADLPGELDAELLVATGAGRLRIVELKPAGGRLMGWCDFVNGHRVQAGERFASPSETGATK